MQAVILANGKFPEHQKPLSLLGNASMLVCCDGAIEHLVSRSIVPNALVGDLDSVDEAIKDRFNSIIHHDPDQYTNDLTKAVKWCMSQGVDSLKIIGATGEREDHTIGNISLLVSYARMGLDVEMITDTGVIKPLLKSTKLQSFRGQQVSVFSTAHETVIYTKNLKYPIINDTIFEWWMGTLNESLGDWFELVFAPGPLIVYQKF